MNVPHAVRPSADQVVAVTDAVCRAHLDMEYADLCRAVVGKLGRKRPSPLTRGDPRIWAAGVVYAVGQLNFVFDPSQSPHATADQLSEWLGVKKTTMANKARLIRDTLKLSHFDGQFMRLNSNGLITPPYAQRRVMRSAGVSVLVGAGSAVERCA
ncbi:MAG TPA: DUF6398 domain-containing protein [Dermatophilaceae bacterium]